MSKFLLSALFCLAFISCLVGQSPDAINYQGVLRNTNGSPIINQDVSIQIAILKGSASGDQVYSEIFTLQTTNLGLFQLEIGRGTPESGEFSDIDWADGSYFIQTAVDQSGGTNYEIFGVSELLSVPYAIYAQNSGQWKNTDTGIMYDKGGVLVINEDANISRRTIKAQTSLSPYSSDFVVGIQSLIDSRRGFILAMEARASSETPSFEGRSIGLRAVGGNATPGANYGVIALVNGSNAGTGILAVDQVRFPSFDHVLRDNNTWAGYFQGNMYVNNFIGLGTSDPVARVHLQNGDIYLEEISSGVIMKSPNGDCWIYRPDNTGQLIGTAITCPN